MSAASFTAEPYTNTEQAEKCYRNREPYFIPYRYLVSGIKWVWEWVCMVCEDVSCAYKLRIPVRGLETYYQYRYRNLTTGIHNVPYRYQ